MSSQAAIAFPNRVAPIEIGRDDYLRVERAIRFLDEHSDEQPGLETVAGHVGLSPHHFQRLFRRWAGVSPKRFLQYLTAERAKRLLRDGASALDSALEAGLSSPSRLHDLLVKVDAVTPGEWKRRGDGLTLRWGIVDSPFGECTLVHTDRGLAALVFRDGRDVAETWLDTWHRDTWPKAELIEDGDLASRTATTIFEYKPQDEPLLLHLRGTNFQIRVWRALLEIPEGMMVSYQDVAVAAGSPLAVRAVGQAVGANPVSFLVPCHRVIRKSGALGNYGGGIYRKRAMLGWEAARTDPTAVSA
ncbi:MAG: methylated-DNA--[protein]-cysteine S-methyltransferase [Acidobacteriota bacterium]